MSSQLQAQALRSAAFLVAGLVDRRFGLRGTMSAELKDAIEILRGELDELGLMGEYLQPDGTLIAWPREEDGNIAGPAARRRARQQAERSAAFVSRHVVNFASSSFCGVII